MAENLLNLRFEADAPNKVRVSDMPCIPTDEGWLCLAGHKELCSGRIVGYAMSERMKTEPVSRSLFKTAASGRPDKGFIHHSTVEVGTARIIIGYLSPAAYEKQFYQKRVAA